MPVLVNTKEEEYHKPNPIRHAMGVTKFFKDLFILQYCNVTYSGTY